MRSFRLFVVGLIGLLVGLDSPSQAGEEIVFPCLSRPTG